MNIAVLVKQVDTGSGLTMDALSRRAVAQGAELAAAVGDGVCTAITLGPSSAEEVLREAVAWGRTSNVTTYGVLLDDPPAAGGDTLDAAHALAAVVEQEGPFELVLLGARSEPDGTALLGPQVAELLDLPFVASARFLSMQGRWLHVRGEHDEAWMQATVALPAVISCSAGLIDAAEASPEARALVPPEYLRAVEIAASSGARRSHSGGADGPVAIVGPPGNAIVEQATTLAARHDADIVVLETDTNVEEDVARGIAIWATQTHPRALLVPANTWGREVAGRLAVQLGVEVARAVDESGEARPLLITVHAKAAPSPPPSTELETVKVATTPRQRVRVVSRTARDT